MLIAKEIILCLVNVNNLKFERTLDKIKVRTLLTTQNIELVVVVEQSDGSVNQFIY